MARQAAKIGQMVAVCDVDARHRYEFNKDFDEKLGMYNDYRTMIEKEKPDIVTIGTPDHWHIPIAEFALRSGADVYCEKPLTLTIQEGIEIRQVVEETGRVFQVGTQQRSEMEGRFLKAIAIVRSGRIGGNVNAYVAIGGAPTGGPFEAKPVPNDLDWDMWLGPAPEADYSEERRRMFRWFFEYSGGKMTDWGAHHIDIAQWALGQDTSGPVEVSGTGKFTPLVPDNFNWSAFLNGEATLPNGFNTATKFNIDLKFGNGAVLSVNDFFKRDDGVEFGNGILFEGDKGRIFVNRGKLQGKAVNELTEKDNEELDAIIAKLYKGKKPGSHMRNFFECVEDRTPASLRCRNASPHHDIVPSLQHWPNARSRPSLGSSGREVFGGRSGECSHVANESKAASGYRLTSLLKCSCRERASILCEAFLGVRSG